MNRLSSNSNSIPTPSAARFNAILNWKNNDRYQTQPNQQEDDEAEEEQTLLARTSAPPTSSSSSHSSLSLSRSSWRHTAAALFNSYFDNMRKQQRQKYDAREQGISLHVLSDSQTDERDRAGSEGSSNGALHGSSTEDRSLLDGASSGPHSSQSQYASASVWHRCLRWIQQPSHWFKSTPNFRERTIYFNSTTPHLYAAPGPSGTQLDPSPASFPTNALRNTKYSLLTFVPHFLYEQFAFFFNFYFLIVALSQFIPVLQIGFLFTYVAPLVFVLVITLMKEGMDDLTRWKRDREANSQRYTRLNRRYAPSGEVESFEEEVPSSEIRVGDLLILHVNQRVPADLLLLRTRDKTNHTVFIRTDQLDGETDWKLRQAVHTTQNFKHDLDLFRMQNSSVQCEQPRKAIYEFLGNFVHGEENNAAAGSSGGSANAASSSTAVSSSTSSASAAGGSASTSTSAPSSSSAAAAAAGSHTEPLSLENTLWANTVLASGSIIGLVIYTGRETRAVMNANLPTTKIGLLDHELNQLSKLLFVLTLCMAFIMTALKGLHGMWFIYLFRFILLFSSIIPISMRVNLDMSKSLYSWLIEHDKNIPDTLVRNSTIPEELGRISYLFSDKTGTLTRNVMTFKCLQMEPPVFFTRNTMNRLRAILKSSYRQHNENNTHATIASSSSSSSSSSSAPSLSPASSLVGGRDAIFDEQGPVVELQHPSVAIDPHDDDDDNDDDEQRLTKSRTSVHQMKQLRSKRKGGKKKGYAQLSDDEEDEHDDAEEEEEDSFATNASARRVASPRASSDEHSSSSQLQQQKVQKRGGGKGAASNRSSSHFDDDDEDDRDEAEEEEEEDSDSDELGSPSKGSSSAANSSYSPGSNTKLEGMVRRVITGLALCHNVTPVIEEDNTKTYQASSPDEVALVKFTESVGLTLAARTQTRITLRTPLADPFAPIPASSPTNAIVSSSSSSATSAPMTLSSSAAAMVAAGYEEYEVLHIFPFTSDSKRMGIIVRCLTDGVGAITFYLKGAESIMKHKIIQSDWLEEEVDNLARVGLRTLVFAMKVLSDFEYSEFLRKYTHAKSMLKERDTHIIGAMASLEKNMTLLGLTGVEDKLQNHVKPTLETLRNAGIALWMLTGDKAETATCIGISARLIDRNQPIFQFLNCNTQREAARQLDVFSTKINTCLVIDGPSLQLCLDSFQKLFLELACVSPAVICCRCSPTQKATVVELMKTHTNKRTAAIGDGGNDVSMILSADVGVGIVGKEGKQASLAADFSITQFSHVLPLLLWHGRNSYKRSARLSQFVIHRGLIISIIQAVFSALFFFAAVPVYTGWLMVGYATFYTMLPVFSLVLDEDVDESKVYLYPELYKDLQKGRPLSYKTFFIWVFQSVYQGGVIMIFSIVLFEAKFLNIVSITFTSLIASELLNVALEIHTWHKFMIGAEVLSVVVYFVSLLFLNTYFDITFIFTFGFLWKVGVITTVSCLPPALIKYLHGKYNPSAQSKVNQS